MTTEQSAKLEAIAKGLQNGMFSDRPTIREAFDYAFGIAKATGDNEIAVLTAIMVVSNTIGKTIQSIITEEI